MGRLENSLARFQREVNAFTKTLEPKHLASFQQKVALEALRRVVLKTPVDTGRARGNWQVEIDRSPEGALETTDPSGNGTIATGSGKIRALRKLARIHIANNVPYIVRLEHGHSKQAPRGMLRLTLVELRSMFRRGRSSRA